MVFIIVILLTICICLLVSLYRTYKNVDELSMHIENFLLKGKTIPYSLSDNRFSKLYNNVSDLENAVIVERNNSIKEMKESADFVADVSHQLKTPLAGIKLYCEMSKDDTYKEKELLLIEKTEKLIQQLICLEKLKSNAYVMQFKSENIENIINELIDEIRTMYPDKNFVCTGSAVLRSDRMWMSEAIGNIIKNACEHTKPDGTIKIHIGCENKTVLITIIDDGGGVAQEEIPSLFTRFYRARNASVGSNGLGLAISKMITEKHHGSIFAENAASGLKITFCLPIIDGRTLI